MSMPSTIVKPSWATESDLVAAYEDTKKRLAQKSTSDEDKKAIIALLQRARIIPDGGLNGKGLASLFLKWRKEGGVPLPSLLALACEFFDIPDAHPMKDTAETACVLGEIEHDNAYHHNHHFHEVFIILMCMCAYHVGSCKDAELMFSDDDLLLMIIAVAIHDFAHDGGDMIENENIPSRLEHLSIDKAAPFLKNAGLSEEDIAHIRLMVVCTDAIRMDDGQSPTGTARDIYLAHKNKTLQFLDVDNFYKPLVSSYKFALMTRMLGEADITPSAGIYYEFSKLLTIQISQENDVLRPAAATLYGFLEIVCYGGYNTPSAKALFGANFLKILTHAKNDTANGAIYS